MLAERYRPRSPTETRDGDLSAHEIDAEKVLRDRTASVVEVDRHALALCEPFKHALERVLAAEPALFEPAVWLPQDLTDALIHLHPARVDRVRGPKGFTDVARPHVRREPVVGVVRHLDRFRFVGPRNRHENGTEDLFLRDSPVVSYVGDDRRLDVVALGERSFLRR